MCGICGWVDFKNKYTERTELVKAMTHSLAHRGPDGQGMWNDKYASLGHQRLAIIDIEHGAQPMEARNHAGNHVVIAFNGQVFNFKELREELKNFGYQFDTNSDTEVLLKGYLHWRENVVHHLNGMYAVSIWDCKHSQLLLFRDRMGIKPLYYALTETGVVFASEPKALFISSMVAPRMTRNGFCELLDMVKTPERTIYDGVFEVRPGSMLIFDRNGLRKETYWALQAQAHHDSLDLTIDTVKNLLTDTVRRQIISDVPVCSLLSGGLDSSAITAMAAKELTQGSLPSFSVDFTHNIELFQADGVRGAPDAPFARLLAEYAGTQHTELLLRSEEMLHGSIRHSVLRAVDAPPAYWGDMWPSLYLLFRELKTHSSVALSGEGADEIFGGYQWFRNPAARDAETFPWLTAGSSRYFGGIQLLSRDLLASLEREKYRAERYQEALQEVPLLQGESADDRRMRQISYLAITRFLPTLLDRNDRMSMAVGLEVRVPFCDHRLVEYVFNTPWSMKSFDGREKSLLRAATQCLLPESIINRIKTPYPATQDGAYEKGLRAELAVIAENNRSPVYDLIDRQKIIALLNRESSEISQPYNRGSIEMVLWMNRWMNEYQVSVAV
ncbi:asparagine synthase (glutamine-hydrolyzing) [Brenneria rubrifaciens]|uniref:asparagine synthase (glutamine-hydrolyzing) n=1 Tax=Brenneria rubrifaciens TaxID=55213 RepID=A0A4P8QWB7_9GAMM|nr:asparagine synthase (glutamine-hydrolyzing) [Brenneria rubrifaciens]QCR07674.1 asparagine synthase (glutamine-hydrolyzing) [Brenneria rubrifaciens]